MKDDLAERLLAKVMNWGPGEVAEHRPILQAMAQYKYDEYQQFSPGMRFVESLALWLRQFDVGAERQAAYDFVDRRLLFCSSAEMNHLVSEAYTDLVKPVLFEKSANELGVAPQYVGRITESVEFRVLRRQTLFLALSDGAHTDVFRRNNPELSHEQIWHAYDFSKDKAKGMAVKLKEGLAQILGRAPTAEESRFRILVLLDDFSGSGRSYLRAEEVGGVRRLEGKVRKAIGQFDEPDGNLHPYISHDELQICLVIYLASQDAKEHLEQHLAELLCERYPWIVRVGQLLPRSVKVTAERDPDFVGLINDDRYYDPEVEDEHTKKGGGNVRFGFANCSLPLVLSHNTPNNSVFLLWGSPELNMVRGLFPRISRHQRQA